MIQRLVEWLGHRPPIQSTATEIDDARQDLDERYRETQRRSGRVFEVSRWWEDDLSENNYAGRVREAFLLEKE